MDIEIRSWNEDIMRTKRWAFGSADDLMTLLASTNTTIDEFLTFPSAAPMPASVRNALIAKGVMTNDQHPPVPPWER